MLLFRAGHFQTAYSYLLNISSLCNTTECCLEQSKLLWAQVSQASHVVHKLLRNCMRDPQLFKICLHLRRYNLFIQPHYLIVFFFTLGELSSSVVASGKVDFVSIWCYNSVVSYRQREGMETQAKTLIRLI